MIGFYGMGGGLGHLTRIKTFIQNLELDQDSIKVITANPKADRFFSDHQIIQIPAEYTTTPQQLKGLIQIACKGYFFEQLYVDTFPAGILGELDLELIATQEYHYLARRMNWEAYEHFVRTPLPFKSAFCFEELSQAHHDFISKNAQEVQSCEFHYPEPNSAERSQQQASNPLWLVVHSTYEEELNLLIDHAMDVAQIISQTPEIMVLTDVDLKRPGIQILHSENPLNWYPRAAKIFTAAGFNTWYQITPWRSKHICLPQIRKYDDQFWRASASNPKNKL